VIPGTSAIFGKLIADETEKWAKVVKFAGLKSDSRATSELSLSSNVQQGRGNAREGNAMAIAPVGPDLPRSVVQDGAARRASRKAARRLIPFLILCFLVAYVDRVNVR
jgi:hypothetical protein